MMKYEMKEIWNSLISNEEIKRQRKKWDKWRKKGRTERNRYRGRKEISEEKKRRSERVRQWHIKRWCQLVKI